MAAGLVLTAGSSEGNDIAIAHPTVSRRHVELRVNGDGSFDVFDLGAAAGTFVFHKEKWTRFEHATVAGDERLRLGSYETTADALFEMAGEGAVREPGGPAGVNSGPPGEDVHEVSTHRSRERRQSAGEEREGEEERTARAGSARTSKKEPETVKLPARHAGSQATSGPTAGPARRRSKPQTVKLPARHAAKSAPETASPPQAPAAAAPAAPDIDAPGEAPKSLAAAYLLWALLGGFGAHRFYLGSIGIGIAHAALLVAGAALAIVFGGEFFDGELFDKGLPTIFALLGVAVLACLAVWLIVDAFLIPGLVRDRRGTPGAGN